MAFLIIIITLAQGYNLVATGALRGIGTHFIAYIPASVVCPCQLGEVGPFFKDVYTPTFNSSLVETIKQLPGVEDAAPYLMLPKYFYKHYVKKKTNKEQGNRFKENNFEHESKTCLVST